MAKKKSEKTNAAKWVVLAAVAVLALLVVLILLLGPEKKDNLSGTTPGESQTQGTTPQESTTPRPTIQIIDMIDGTYEQWLGAAGLMGTLMGYPGCTDQTVYFLSETDLDDKMSSQGVYLTLTYEAEQIVLHLKPLEAERTEAGTTDVYCQQTGFATWDVVENVDLAGLTPVTIPELEDYLEQVILPGLYQH